MGRRAPECLLVSQPHLCPPANPGKLKLRLHGVPPTSGFHAEPSPLGRIGAYYGVLEMAQICDICGKGPQFGNNISHAHNVSRRRWNVNLHPVRAKVNGGNKRLRVCSSCLKAGKVVKA